MAESERRIAADNAAWPLGETISIDINRIPQPMKAILIRPMPPAATAAAAIKIHAVRLCPVQRSSAATTSATGTITAESPRSEIMVRTGWEYGLIAPNNRPNQFAEEASRFWPANDARSAGAARPAR